MQERWTCRAETAGPGRSSSPTDEMRSQCSWAVHWPPVPCINCDASVGLCVAKAQFEFKSGPNVPFRPHLDIPRNEKVATLDHEQACPFD